MIGQLMLREWWEGQWGGFKRRREVTFSPMSWTTVSRGLVAKGHQRMRQRLKEMRINESLRCNILR